MSVECVPADEIPTARAAQERIRPRRLVHLLDVLKNVLLVHECLVTESAFLRFSFATDFDVACEVNAVCVTTPARGALVGFNPIMTVHMAFKLDFMPEASITNFTLK